MKKSTHARRQNNGWKGGEQEIEKSRQKKVLDANEDISERVREE